MNYNQKKFPLAFFPQEHLPRAAPRHPAPPTPQQPLTTWGQAPCMASLPNFTVSIALHAVNLLATSRCPPWLTPPHRPLPLLHHWLATRSGAPTPHRCFLSSCTPHLLLPAPVLKVQSRQGPPCCSECSQQRSLEHPCCLLPPLHHPHLLLLQVGCLYASIAWRWHMGIIGENHSTVSTACKACLKWRERMDLLPHLHHHLPPLLLPWEEKSGA